MNTVQLLVALFLCMLTGFTIFSPIFKQRHFILGDCAISFYFYRCNKIFDTKTTDK
jgi:hypothetical protein